MAEIEDANLAIGDQLEVWAMISIGEVWLPATVVYVDDHLIQVRHLDGRPQILRRQSPGWRRVGEQHRPSSASHQALPGGDHG